MKAVTIGLLIFSLIGCTSQKAPQTAAGNVAASSKPLTEEDLGLKFYPGSRVLTSGQTNDALSANLETADPAAKVAAFYEQQLGTKAETKAGLTSIEGVKGSNRYAVAIDASGGKTSISIMGAKR